jgi:hypothetical protein
VEHWERCNILDGSNDVLTKLPKLIGKLTFGCLVNLKENQLEKLAKGLISWIVTIRERPKGGGRPNLNSMYDISKIFKRKAIIQNEIMIHFAFPKLTTNNQRPYKDEAWHTLKMQHKMDKMFFFILDMELFEDFYSKRPRISSIQCPANQMALCGWPYSWFAEFIVFGRWENKLPVEFWI